MDTKLLERFATWARRELINAVDAQATAVLAVGSVARSERAEVIRKLEAEIARHGRQQVVDKVAYIWFNRIIALRFMDARGYTDAAVVSPAQGQAHGQPEILADAKRGNVDTDVVTNTRTAEGIIGLLDGTRRSTDAEGEAYALLLTEYCCYWHKSMPFMFEREGDYTELLVPANLLADDAILARAREVLTEDVCDDVEVIGWLYQFYISERKVEVFAGFKKNKKAGADEIPAATQLFTPHWIVRYLVENSLGRLWMLNRPTSRLVDKMDYFIAPVDEEADFLKLSKPEELTVIDPACGSGHMLTYAFDLLYTIYEEEGYAPSEIPGLVLTHNLQGTEIDPRAGSLAAFALTMKARAKHRNFLNKQVEPKICVIDPISFAPDELDLLVTPGGDRHEEEAFWNQFAEADTLGSLIPPDASLTARLGDHLETLDGAGDMLKTDTIGRAERSMRQAEFLARQYSVVVANPPYMGSKNMNAQLVAFAKEQHPDSKADLFAMFIERCLGLTKVHGATAMITMQSWMFISSYEGLRASIVSENPPSSMLHLGERAFDSIGGSVVSTTAFVLERNGDVETKAVYVRAVGGVDEASKRAMLLDAIGGGSVLRFSAAANDFAKVPGAPIAYWLSDGVRAAFRGTIEQREKNVAKGVSRDPLGDEVRVAKGITTGENARYLRFWWEIARSDAQFDRSGDAPVDRKRWVAADKGGEFRRWYGNNDYVIDWMDDGRPIIESASSTPRNLSTAFQRSLACSKISSGDVAFRAHARGFVFTDAAVSVTSDVADLDVIASFLNSSTAQALLTALAPTLNFEVGQIRSLPNPVFDRHIEASSAVRTLTEVARADWDSFETSWDFGSNPLVNEARGASTSDRRRARLSDHVARYMAESAAIAHEQRARETANNELVATEFGLGSEVKAEVPLHRVTLNRNPEFRYGAGKRAEEYATLACADAAAELVSYAVGCIFGRYGLEKPGLILADQGATLRDYFEKIPMPAFKPDVDNVIPFVDDGWFEDDIVERFREFLRATFGTEHFEENYRFVEESLGVKTLRDYFITRSGVSKFYADHVQRYKKRPIYWMFSSSKGSFNALIYMHRYTPSTVSTVLNEYLREYRAKLEVALANAEQAAAGGGSAKEQKEADRLRKVLLELAEYEHDVLYPLATQQIVIDLDDGVKANYPKFYPALKSIAGLEATE